MDDFNSETDSDYTSYWRDWVSAFLLSSISLHPAQANRYQPRLSRLDTGRTASSIFGDGTDKERKSV